MLYAVMLCRHAPLCNLHERYTEVCLGSQILTLTDILAYHDILTVVCVSGILTVVSIERIIKVLGHTM